MSPIRMLAITQAKFGVDSDFTSIAKVVEERKGPARYNHATFGPFPRHPSRPL
jgi:hypothetical protein